MLLGPIGLWDGWTKRDNRGILRFSFLEGDYRTKRGYKENLFFAACGAVVLNLKMPSSGSWIQKGWGGGQLPDAKVQYQLM